MMQPASVPDESAVKTFMDVGVHAMDILMARNLKAARETLKAFRCSSRNMPRRSPKDSCKLQVASRKEECLTTEGTEEKAKGTKTGRGPRGRQRDSVCE